MKMLQDFLGFWTLLLTYLLCINAQQPSSPKEFVMSTTDQFFVISEGVFCSHNSSTGLGVSKFDGNSIALFEMITICSNETTQNLSYLSSSLDEENDILYLSYQVISSGTPENIQIRAVTNGALTPGTVQEYPTTTFPCLLSYYSGNGTSKLLVTSQKEIVELTNLKSTISSSSMIKFPPSFVATGIKIIQDYAYITGLTDGSSDTFSNPFESSVSSNSSLLPPTRYFLTAISLIDTASLHQDLIDNPSDSIELLHTSKLSVNASQLTMFIDPIINCGEKIYLVFKIQQNGQDQGVNILIYDAQFTRVGSISPKSISTADSVASITCANSEFYNTNGLIFLVDTANPQSSLPIQNLVYIDSLDTDPRSDILSPLPSLDPQKSDGSGDIIYVAVRRQVEQNSLTTLILEFPVPLDSPSIEGIFKTFNVSVNSLFTISNVPSIPKPSIPCTPDQFFDPSKNTCQPCSTDLSKCKIYPYTPPMQSQSAGTTDQVGLGVGLTILFIVLIILAFFIWRRKRKGKDVFHFDGDAKKWFAKPSESTRQLFSTGIFAKKPSAAKKDIAPVSEAQQTKPDDHLSISPPTLISSSALDRSPYGNTMKPIQQPANHNEDQFRFESPPIPNDYDDSLRDAATKNDDFEYNDVKRLPTPPQGFYHNDQSLTHENEQKCDELKHYDREDASKWTSMMTGFTNPTPVPSDYQNSQKGQQDLDNLIKQLDEEDEKKPKKSWIRRSFQKNLHRRSKSYDDNINVFASKKNILPSKSMSNKLSGYNRMFKDDSAIDSKNRNVDGIKKYSWASYLSSRQGTVVDEGVGTAAEKYNSFGQRILTPAYNNSDHDGVKSLPPLPKAYPTSNSARTSAVIPFRTPISSRHNSVDHFSIQSVSPNFNSTSILNITTKNEFNGTTHSTSSSTLYNNSQNYGSKGLSILKNTESSNSMDAQKYQPQHFAKPPRAVSPEDDQSPESSRPVSSVPESSNSDYMASIYKDVFIIGNTN